jgi:hypothetical protein
MEVDNFKTRIGLVCLVRGRGEPDAQDTAHAIDRETVIEQ